MVDEVLQDTVHDMARGSAPPGLCCVAQFDSRIGSHGWYGLTGRGSELDVEKQLVRFTRLALHAGYEDACERTLTHATIEEVRCVGWSGSSSCAGCPTEDDYSVIKDTCQTSRFPGGLNPFRPPDNNGAFSRPAASPW